MDAIFFSLFAAFFFGINAILIRKALLKVNPLMGTFLGVAATLGPVALYCFLIGDFSYGYQLTPSIIGYLGLAGLSQLVVGQTFFYYSIKIIGASRAHILSSTQLVYAVVFGSLILNEIIKISLGVGVFLIVIGISLTSSAIPSNKDYVKYAAPPRARFYGILFGLLCGLCWGLSMILMKVGVSGVTSASLSNLVSYVFAVAGYPVLLFGTGNMKGVKTIDRLSLACLLGAGATVCAANVCRYVSLQSGNVSLVAPIAGTGPLFTMIFSYLFIQRIERITSKTVLGVLSTLAGLYLIALI